MTQVESELSKHGVDVSRPIELIADTIGYIIPGGKRAVTIWHALMPQAANLGVWPLICGTPDELEHFADNNEHWAGQTAGELLARVPGFPPPTSKKSPGEQLEETRRLMKERGIEMPSFLEDVFAAAAKEENHSHYKPDFSTWPASPERAEHRIVTAYGLGESEPKECLLALVPSSNPSDAPAHLRFGDWNDCPPPEIHVAYLRHWFERYGAVPIGIMHDVIELFVPRPPSTPEEAWDLACEQESYCSDIVTQGTQTVECLAMELWHSPYWFFWWD